MGTIGFEPITARLSVLRSTIELRAQNNYYLVIKNKNKFKSFQLHVPVELPCYDFVKIIVQMFNNGHKKLLKNKYNNNFVTT